MSKGYTRKIVLDFDYNQVKEGIPQVNRQMSLLNAEYKAAQAEVRATGTEVDKYSVAQKKLEEQIKIVNGVLNENKKRFSEAVEKHGEGSKQAEDYSYKVSKNEAELKRLGHELSFVSGRLEESKQKLENATNATEELDSVSTDWEKQLKILNAEYKANELALDDSAKKVDEYRLKQEHLKDTIELVKGKIEDYKGKLTEASNEFGEGSIEVQKYSDEISLAEAELKQIQSELSNVNKSLEEQKTTLGKTSAEWSDISDKLNSTGKKMTLGITTPLVAAGTAAFKLSSDYEQALGKVDTVFDVSSSHIKQWASNSLEDFGLAKSTATAMAADFGALFKGIDGISDASTRDWSMALTERVMDLSNYYDTTVEETERALQSIVTGQAEPMKKFGIIMTEATLQEYAYSQGIQKKMSEMTNAEKTQLRYNYVMKQTSDAVGTTARESDSANGQMNLMKENAKELGLSIGENLLPIIVPILEGTNGLLKGFNSLDDGTKSLIVRVLGLAAVIGPMLILISKIIDTVIDAKKSFEKVSGAINTVADAGEGLTKGSSKGFGMPKLIQYAVVLAAAAMAIAIAFDVVFRKGETLKGLGDSLANNLSVVMGNQKQQVQGAVNQAAMRGYAVGTNYVDRDQDARIHKGEAIIPENENPWNPNAKTPFGLGGGNTYIMQVDAERIKSVTDLINLFENFTQVANAGMVIG